jgi:hypothetical protein
VQSGIYRSVPVRRAILQVGSKRVVVRDRHARPIRQYTRITHYFTLMDRESIVAFV